MTEILVDVWLYGNLAAYAGEASQEGYANLQVRLAQSGTIAGLLAYLQMPTEKRGITFINGELSAMPGVQPDLSHPLCDGDRVAFFHLSSMWPFQYRHGVPMVSEMAKVMNTREDQAVRHSYQQDDPEK
jgi:hypothetical protein